MEYEEDSYYDEQQNQQQYRSIAGIAELLGTPSDIPFNIQSKFFPFMNKIVQLTNMSEREIMNVLDDLELSRIYSKSEMTEDEFESTFNMDEFVRLRAYLTAAITCSKDGFMPKRLTTVYKHSTLEDGAGSRRTGVFGSLFGRRGGSSE